MKTANTVQFSLFIWRYKTCTTKYIYTNI